MMIDPDSNAFKVGLVFGLLVQLTFIGVIIWGIVRLVTHYTN